MKKKKILFLITKSNWGGAQRYVYDLATNLPKDEFDVSVALGGDGILKENLETAGIRVLPIKGLQRDISFRKELLSFWEIAHLIRDEDPDIFHVNSSKAGFIGAVLGRILGVPRVIFTAHGWAFNEDRSTISKLFVGFFHWLTVISSHTTIAVSHGMKAQMKWPWTQAKMQVVHLGRTISAMKDKAEARREIAEYAPKLAASNDTWIGCIGELHPIKRHPLSITAVKTLLSDFPTLKLVIVSGGELYEELQNMLEKEGLEEHIFLTGAIPEAARLLKAFDVFVLPSKSESFGYVLLEAGQAKLPVVSTETGGITDLITSGENGLLVPVDDQESLTNALRTVLSDQTLATELAAEHHRRMGTITVEKMVRETIAVYTS